MTRPGPTAQARALIGAGQHRRAIEVLSGALASDPADGEAWYLMAQCHIVLDDPARGIDAARRAGALLPDSEWPHRLLSIAFVKTRAFVDARREAERAIAAAPDLWRTHAQLVRVDCAADRIIDVTWQAARRAVELAPDESDAHFVLGYVSLLSEHNDLARAEFLESLRLDPDNAVARNNLAVIDMRRRRLFRAIPHLMGALRLDPNLETSARNLRVLLRNVCVLMAPLVVIVGDIARASKPVMSDGSTYHGRTAGLVVANAVLVGVSAGVAGLLRERLGPRVWSILRASMRVDKWLACTVVLSLTAVACGVVAAALGFPAATAWQGASMACAALVVVIALILRVRAKRKPPVVKVDQRHMR